MEIGSHKRLQAAKFDYIVNFPYTYNELDKVAYCTFMAHISPQCVWWYSSLWCDWCVLERLATGERSREDPGRETVQSGCWDWLPHQHPGRPGKQLALQAAEHPGMNLIKEYLGMVGWMLKEWRVSMPYRTQPALLWFCFPMLMLLLTALLSSATLIIVTISVLVITLTTVITTFLYPSVCLNLIAVQEYHTNIII